MGFAGVSLVNNLPAVQQMHRRCQFDSWVRRIPWRRAWQPTPVFLLGKSHGQRTLVDYSTWGHKELEMTEANECTHIVLNILYSMWILK